MSEIAETVREMTRQIRHAARWIDHLAEDSERHYQIEDYVKTIRHFLFEILDAVEPEEHP